MEYRFAQPDLERASPETIRGLQINRIQSLLAKTWATNPFFRDHWRGAKLDIDRIDSLESFGALVPPVTKQDLVRDQNDEPPFGRRHRHVLSLGVPIIACTSSGTSGQGVEIHLQTNEDFANHSRLNVYYFTWAGMRRADRTFLTMHVSLLAGGRCELQAGVDFGLSMFPVAFYDTEQRVKLIERFRPRALFGTTSYFGHLAAVAGARTRELGIEILLTGAEGASIAWFQKLEQQFGARAYDRFGLSFMSCDHMFTCEHGIGTRERPGVLHNIDPDIVLEVIDPASGRHVADGEAGEIVLTSLYRTDTPMIRVRTGDRAIYRTPGSCACGRVFSGIEIGSVGRLDDVKKIKGINVWPQAIDDLLFTFPEVDDYQVVLTTDDRASDVATVRIMPPALMDGEAKARLAETLARALRAKAGIGFQVDVLDPGSIERSMYKARRWCDERAQFTQGT
jgi:phenylacetate-CoA ligase